jgi:hypothetical protein
MAPWQRRRWGSWLQLSPDTACLPACLPLQTMHPAWEGFDTEAMWEDLAAIDVQEGLTAK